MARREHGHQVLVEELGRHDLVAAEGKRDDGQVQLARRQLLFQLDARSLGHVEVDVGVTNPQQVEELGHQPAPGRTDHPEPDGAHDLLAHGGDVGDHGLDLVHDPTGPLDHDLALLGRPARRPVDELDVELALEARHVGGDVRLDRPDGGGGGGEAPGVCDAQKCLQMFQFHVLASCPVCLLEFKPTSL